MSGEHGASIAPPDRMLLDLGHKLGIDGLCFSREGLCELVFDGNRRTVTTCLRHGWVSAVQLQTHPLPPGDPMNSRALEANFLWRGTQGATLALDGERRLWAQMTASSHNPSADDLLHMLERLLDLADAWQTGSARRPLPSAGERDPAHLMIRA